LEKGYQPLIVNFRGASNLAYTSPITYCAYSIGDIKEPLDHIRKQYCANSNRKVFLMGLSLGANIITNYVGLEGKNCFLTAVASVQPPIKMWECGH